MQGPNFERSHDGRSFGGRGRKGGFGGPPDDGFGPPFGSFDGSIATLMLRSEDSNADLMSRLLKILTPDQREKWNELTGPDFKAAIDNWIDAICYQSVLHQSQLDFTGSLAGCIFAHAGRQRQLQHEILRAPDQVWSNLFRTQVLPLLQGR